MVQEVFGVALEFAFGLQRKAAAERVCGLFVELTRNGARVALTPEFVGGEFTQPAQRVPQPGVVRPGFDSTLGVAEPDPIAPPPRDEQRREVLERLSERRVELDGPLRERDGAAGVARRCRCTRVVEQALGARVRRRQRMPSTSLRASSSVKTRNELVRTLPWPLTASETRVIVSSSGASAITT